jgi:small subunit ribosomal protein SAe
MERYAFKRRADGIHVINVEAMWQKMQLAARVIVAVENPQVRRKKREEGREEGAPGRASGSRHLDVRRSTVAKGGKRGGGGRQERQARHTRQAQKLLFAIPSPSGHHQPLLSPHPRPLLRPSPPLSPLQDVAVLSARPYGQRAILKFAQYTGAKALAGRHTPGTFTNHTQKVFTEPRLLILTDPRTDHQPVKEASYMSIPTIAFADTDCALPHVDVAIPANNKGKHALGVLYYVLARMVLRMRGTIGAGEAWPVPVDLFFYRDPEEVAAAEEEEAGGGGENATAVEAMGADSFALPAGAGADAGWDEAGAGGYSTAGPGPAGGEEWGAAAPAGGAEWEAAAAAPAAAAPAAPLEYAAPSQFGAQY